MNTQAEMDFLAAYLKRRGMSDSDAAGFLVCCAGRMVGQNATDTEDAKATTRTLCAALAGACARRLQERGIPDADEAESEQPPHDEAH